MSNNATTHVGELPLADYIEICGRTRMDALTRSAFRQVLVFYAMCSAESHTVQYTDHVRARAQFVRSVKAAVSERQGIRLDVALGQAREPIQIARKAAKTVHK